jgi:hypothetical protein
VFRAPPLNTILKTYGIQYVADERQRQMEVEGYLPSHDQLHHASELALAAACYVLPQSYRKLRLADDNAEIGWALWPFERTHWRPSTDDRVKELIKGGALVVAEIDRLLDT